MFKMLLYIRFRSRALAKFYNARFPAKCGNRFAKKKFATKDQCEKEKISKCVAKLSLIFAFFWVSFANFIFAKKYEILRKYERKFLRKF